MVTNFPRAQAQARVLKQALVRHVSNQNSPPTMIATVVDTTTQLSQGFVHATTNSGPIQVSGVPLFSVCPGTQIYVRRMAGKSAYIFDGLAGAYTNRTTSSGSLTTITGTVAGTSVVGSTLSTSNILTLTGGVRFFLAFSFSVASVPAPGTNIVLAELVGVNSGGSVMSSLQVVYTNTGQLDVLLSGWPNSYTPGNPTTEVFAPRSTWFVCLELGLGLQVNGIQTASMKNITSIIANPSLPSGTYGLFLLGDHLGSQVAPSGSWISKVILGEAPWNNLLSQDQFSWETDTSGVTQTNNGGGLTVSLDTTYASQGIKSLHIVSAGSAGQYDSIVVAAPQASFLPNTSYVATFDIRGSGQLYVDWSDGIGTQYSAAYRFGSSNPLTNTGWQQISIPFTTSSSIPSAGLGLKFITETSGVGYSAWIDTFSITLAGESTEFFPFSATPTSDTDFTNLLTTSGYTIESLWLVDNQVNVQPNSSSSNMATLTVFGQSSLTGPY